jgi:hypothetical protein
MYLNKNNDLFIVILQDFYVANTLPVRINTDVKILGESSSKKIKKA